ncbi:MAG: hypothetical protein NC181_03470 [Clostridium sp.]|nr:hypothetical protein [Clostridium sp.]MCM1444349.1 hypothetical protein [Candidatus Amulumruptor caecigallinarius]
MQNRNDKKIIDCNNFNDDVVASYPDNKSLLEPVIKIETFSLYFALKELIAFSIISSII